MNQQVKNCQSCKENFTIEPEDFDFYEKMKVPAPTWCPDCRLQRRIIFRNDRLLYKRESAATKKIIFSQFPDSSFVKVYEREEWFSDKWDGTEYGKTYDFSRPFFEQLKTLLQEVPLVNLSVFNMVNSDYCNNCSDVKNSYLIFGGSFVENCAYGLRVTESKECFDVSSIYKGELCYDCSNINQGHKNFFSEDCENSVDVYFCKNLKGCSDCFSCANLNGKSYHIFNKPYSKEQYFEELKKYDFGSYASMLEIKKQAKQFWLQFPRRYMHGRQNQNVSGDYVFNSKNVFHSFNVREGEDLKYCFNTDKGPVKDSQDFSLFGQNAELIYEGSVCGLNVHNIRFCHECWKDTKDLEYCLYCVTACSNCFGCVGLRNKQYCILNKQYTREEYEALVPKIIEHMNKEPYIDAKGRVYKYGEFFPFELSPFAYNETMAQEYFPLTKEQASLQGFRWRDVDARGYIPTLKTEAIPDHIKDVEEAITNEIIQCAHGDKCTHQCTKAFKIIPQELQFYRQMNLPIPRLCPNCRHYERVAQRTPLKLWQRVCMCDKPGHNHVGKCTNEFETSYSPERPEIVYCEECYQKEVL